MDKQALINKLNIAINEAHKEYYELWKMGAQSAIMWEGVRLGLQDAVQIVEGETPRWLREGFAKGECNCNQCLAERSELNA